MSEDDAAFILELRCDPELSRFVHPTPPDLHLERQWIRDYLVRADDFFFVIVDSRSGEAHGTIALYDIDQQSRAGEMGRWMLRKGSLAAADSAMLAYQIGFDRLDLETVYCRTLAANKAVVSFHESAGLRSRPSDETIVLEGIAYPVVEQFVERADWEPVRSRLHRAAQQAALLLDRSATELS